MKRRTLLAAPALLALPNVARAQDARTLRFIPQADLTVLDPMWTTAYVTRNHAFMVYDTLFGQDSQYRPSPQMLESFTTENDGKTWTLTLRPGLLFHDGEPVRARDCVASLQRWGKRDAFGGALMARTDELSAKDDRTLVFRLKTPFALLPNALAKTPLYMPAIMPERIAKTDPFTQVTDMTGSGPYRFKADERVPGARVVYERFAGYKPREGGKTDWTSGPKVVNFDRVVWTTIPDPTTAAQALINNEQDWWDYATADLMPLLSRTRGVKVVVQEPSGQIPILRFNHLQPPFNNRRLRRALLAAVNQDDYMRAGFGDDQAVWRTCRAMMPCGVRDVTEMGLADMPALSVEAARKAVAESGYNGERTVVLAPMDYPQLGAFGIVTADLLRRIGMNVDFQPMDWGTMIARTANREPVEKGGWSLFHTSGSMPSMLNPALNMYVRGQGAKGWSGWYDKPEIEALTQQWLDSPADGSQRELFDRIQRVLFDDPPLLPLGQYGVYTVRRKDITGILDGSASYPWNVRRI